MLIFLPGFFTKVQVDQGFQGQGKFSSIEISCKPVTVIIEGESVFHANLKLPPQYKSTVKQLSSFTEN